MFPLRLIVVLGFLPGLISSQSITAQERQSALLTPEYFIEVGKADGCLFAPIIRVRVPRSITPTSETPNSAPLAESYSANHGLLVYALPRPTHYLPDSAGRPIVSKITFLARQNGDLWHFKVFVGQGEFYDAGEQPAADLMLGTNERAEVGGLERFGISPFRVGVVKVMGQLARKPYVRNKTQSISLEQSEVGMLPEPHRLTLRNNSDKQVLAIQYNSFKDNRFLFLRWVENGPTQPLIKAGDVYRLEVLSQDLTCGDPDGYRASQSDRIDIVSVVFADGSYEGEPGLAALIRGQAIGNKKQLQRVVAALENLSEGHESNPAELIYHLRLLYQELDDAAEPYLAERLQNSLPPTYGPDSIVPLTNLIRSGQHEIRSSLQNDAWALDMMVKTQNAEAIRALCARTVAKYKKWLAESEAATSY